MEENTNTLEMLEQIRQLYQSIETPDHALAERYAWVVVKALYSKELEHDALRSRQYLAECMHLTLQRPSKVYSAILGAACSMAKRFVDFRFTPFLRMWDVRHLRQEDYAPGRSDDGKAFLSLAERATKAYMHAILIRPAEVLPEEQLDVLRPVARNLRYGSPRPMIVAQVRKVETHSGRPMRFAQLVDARGLVLDCEVHALAPHPLVPVPGGRHYVNVGQLYDVLPRGKKQQADEKVRHNDVAVEEAVLSSGRFGETYPLCVGYVDRYDAQHQHYHVFDGQSRHLVAEASSQRLGMYGRPAISAGDYVSFAPIVPRPKSEGGKVFKSAYIVGKYTREDGPAAFGLREAKVMFVDTEKKYYRWELTDASQPIVEQGTTEPSFTSGFVSFESANSPHPNGQNLPEVGEVVQLVVFLHRGKDKQKRPRVVQVIRRPKA